MPLDVTLIGGGMIIHDQILPSLYHLQRTGSIGDIWVCATRTTRLRELAEEPRFRTAFPDLGFRAFPDLETDPGQAFPELYKRVIDDTPPRSLVIVATPETLHERMVTHALEQDQNVLCVKPLVLKHAEAVAIDRLAKDRGLFVGVEYHKRFDRRSLEARDAYRRGRFGQFRIGEAKLIEPWSYRHSNFQNWFTKENTDPFTYIGCHYVDLVYFISGLRPVEVSVKGVEGTFPNGNHGYLWAHGRVTFENGGILSVVNGLGYPDASGGSNDQGMTLFCEGPDSGGIISHDDQYRGVEHGYIAEGSGEGAKLFGYVNPDYFRLVPWTGPGLRPRGIRARLDRGQRAGRDRGERGPRPPGCAPGPR